jgi:hypothetical protein
MSVKDGEHVTTRQLMLLFEGTLLHTVACYPCPPHALSHAMPASSSWRVQDGDGRPTGDAEPPRGSKAAEGAARADVKVEDVARMIDGLLMRASTRGSSISTVTRRGKTHGSPAPPPVDLRADYELFKLLKMSGAGLTLSRMESGWGRACRVCEKCQRG